MTLNCDGCVYAHPIITDDTNQPALKCHRYPPRLFVWDGQLTQSLPDATDWCGEWTEA